MRQELQQAVSSAPVPEELPNPTEFDAALDEEERHNRGDDYYASMEQQRQSELMHEQDEQLDGVFRTVGNLRQQANDMGRELEDQAVMIDEVDTLADRVGGKLNHGMARIRHVIRKNEGKSEMFLHWKLADKWKLEFGLTFRYRYLVFLLHRSTHLCALPIADSRYCPVIIHRRERGHALTVHGSSIHCGVEESSCGPSYGGATLHHPRFHPRPRPSHRDPQGRCPRGHHRIRRIELVHVSKNTSLENALVESTYCNTSWHRSRDLQPWPQRAPRHPQRSRHPQGCQ